MTQEPKNDVPNHSWIRQVKKAFEWPSDLEGWPFKLTERVELPWEDSVSLGVSCKYLKPCKTRSRGVRAEEVGFKVCNKTENDRKVKPKPNTDSDGQTDKTRQTHLREAQIQNRVFPYRSQ